MQFNLFDQAKQDQQRQKFGNALTKSNTSSAPIRHNALLSGSKTNKINTGSTAPADPTSMQKQNMNKLIQSTAAKYAAQEADAYVKAIEEDPLAFDYDSHFDRQKEAEARSKAELAKIKN